jgi:excinuclease UvrABC nuclease subunit
MLSLDEAIEHCEEKAEELERSAKLHQRPVRGVKGSGKRYLSCLKSAKEHRQLAEWLRELKKLRTEQKDVYEKGYEDGYCYALEDSH